MTRPLLITDCDEVLLHMVVPFREWLGEAHDVDFALDRRSFADALTHRATGETVEQQKVWPLLDGFFATEMDRQQPVPGAIDALARIAAVADIVVLTNLGDHCHAGRVAQLERHGIRHRVVCNQGGKGVPVQKLLDEYRPSVAAFVDDLPQHHDSVARRTTGVHRLHMVAEPELAPHVPAAPDAHARIDDWNSAADWLLARFAEGPAAG